MTTRNEWWRGAAIYQIYPRSFMDSNGDGIGDLNGITGKLDYVQSLGVDGIWLSPFFTSPMADFGYDVSDYQNVDPIFGTLKDFDRMIAEMHKRGLKLIIDLVLNHTSIKHAWFAESRQSRSNPKSDWYVWADPKADGTAPNNWLSVFGGPAWRYDTKRGQYYFHQFLKEQPDLNIRNPEVQDKLMEIAKWWMDKGVDGFRLDALNHCMHDALLRDNPPLEGFDRAQPSGRQTHPYYWQRHLYDKTQPEMIPFIKRLRKTVDAYPDRMMVAEIGDDFQIKTSAAYTNGPEMLHTAYNFALLGPNIYKARTIRGIVQEYLDEPGDVWPSWAFSNHDVVRVASRWAVNGKPGDAQAKMMMAMLTSLKGTCFIYQGEELGLPEADVPFEKLQDPFGIFLWPEDKGRDGCRTPFPWDGTKPNAGFSTAKDTWLPIEKAHLEKSAASAEKDKNSVLHFTRNLMKWRKGQKALQRGDIRFIDTPDSVLGFVRMLENESILCVFNLEGAETTFNVLISNHLAPVDGHGLSYKLDKQSLTLPGFGGFFARI